MTEYTTVDADGGNRVLAEQMAQHEALVHWVVRRQWLGNLPFEHALHEGRIGLWSALRHYDPQRGTAFSTYAVPAIAHAVWRAVDLENRLSRSPRIDLPSYPTSDDVGTLDDALVHAALRDLVAQLPARLRYVVIAHHGLDGNAPLTLAAIGRSLGVSRQRVHQLHAQAILWLAHPAHSLRLRRLLGRNTLRDYRSALTRMRRVARRAHRRASQASGRRGVQP